MQNDATLRAVERFLFLEARLLDEKRWEEWNALFVEDGEYWIPATRGQPDPLNHVSIMYEKSLLRAVRLKRYKHPNAMSLQPMPQSVHLISNIMLDSDDGDTVIANSRFIVQEHRRDITRTYGGVYIHTLQRADSSFLIRMKKVELVDCDGALSSMQIYL